MEIEIKGFDAAGYFEIDEIEQLIYDEETEFSFLLTLTIGSKNHPGGDLFSILVSTPNDDCLYYRPNKKHLYIVKHGEGWVEIYSHISNIVRKCSANRWYETVSNLRKVFAWEYEGVKLNGVDLYK